MARLGRAQPGFIWIRGPIVTGQSWSTFQGAVVLIAAGTLTAAGTDIQPASAPTLSVAASMTTAASGIPQGGIALSAAASLSASGLRTAPAAVAITPTVSLTAAGIPIESGAAALSAAASMTVGASQTQFIAAAMASTVTMTVSQATSVQAAAALTVTGALTAGASQSFTVAALMTPSGAMSVAAVRTPQGLVALAPTANLTAGAARTTLSVAALSVAVTLTPGAPTVFPGLITLIGSFSLSALAGQAEAASALLRSFTSLTVGSIGGSSSVRMTPLITLTAIATTGLAVAPRQNYYLRQRQNWAVEQEQQRHAQALYTVGEMACFILMWHEIDFLKGLVGRCQTCYNTPDPLANRITNVYNQPTRNKCPDCFGTTFEGGFRARIVRPVVITDTDETEKPDRRGMVHTDDMDVETTWDFRSRNGDYLLRADGSRWRLNAPQRTTLRTGFTYPAQLTTAIAYSAMRASYEEEGTVAYLLPPTDPAQLGAVLTAQAFWPPDFSTFEILRGDLIPTSIQG